MLKNSSRPRHAHGLWPFANLGDGHRERACGSGSRGRGGEGGGGGFEEFPFGEQTAAAVQGVVHSPLEHIIELLHQSQVLRIVLAQQSVGIASVKENFKNFNEQPALFGALAVLAFFLGFACAGLGIGLEKNRIDIRRDVFSKKSGTKEQKS